MITVISPAKLLNFEPQSISQEFTQPMFLDESQLLINKLKKLSGKKIAELMDLSKKLADLNVERYQQWHLPFSIDNAKQAMFAFNGDVYTGLKAGTFNREDIDFAQKNLRILSGLHGVLRPLDLIQPYRLEMGTKIGAKRAKTLYQFWSKKVTETIRAEIPESGVLINLASNEYFKVIDEGQLKRRIITPVFKDHKNGKYKVLFLYAKQARGMMARFIVKNKIENPEDLKAFEESGYVFNSNLTNGNEWVFTRG